MFGLFEEGFDGVQKNNARIIFIILLLFLILLQLKNWFM
jgi:hypothetical protein